MLADVRSASRSKARRAEIARLAFARRCRGERHLRATTLPEGILAQSEPIIANYDDQTAEEIKQRLRKLSQADLAKLEAYEKQGQARSTVLEAIAALRGDEPWSGYDDMEVEEVNEALRQRDGDAAGRVLDYERRHKARTTVIEFAKRRRDGNDGSSGRTSAQLSS